VSGRDFERQVLRLLEARGFVADITEATADGGIDIVAKRTDPFLAGKYIVQCKNWIKPVGEPVVRDLYGVVMAERANKGILVTTSRFTESARQFAEDKPLELIDGSEWKQLISHAGTSQVQDLKEAELTEETRRAFELAEHFIGRMKRFLADLDVIHDDPPPIALSGNEFDKRYDLPSRLDEWTVNSKEYLSRYRLLESRMMEEVRSICDDLSKHIQRWPEFVQTLDSTTAQPEDTDQFSYYIERWEHLLGRLLSVYKDLHKIPPPPPLRNAHSLALEGIYHLASACAFMWCKSEQEYDEVEDKVTLILSGEEDLYLYHLEEGQALFERASEQTATMKERPKQRKSWYERFIGR